MAEYSIQDTTLTGMANQIRTMHGTTGTMTPSTMIEKLQDANTEISEQEAMLVEIANTLQTKAIGTPPKLQSKTVTPSASSQTVVADSGYDGLSQVTVNGDGNLVAENIAEGVSIFGVTGTHAGGSGSSGGGSGNVETCTVILNPNGQNNVTIFYTDSNGTLQNYIMVAETITIIKNTIMMLSNAPSFTISGECTQIMNTMGKIAYAITGDCSIVK